jgi:hypothetical protein
MLPPHLATTSGRITVVGGGSSGEAEVCLVVDGDETFVSLASDHTDRQAESIDIGLSKAICPKPLAAEGWPIADVDGRWDELVLRSWIVEGNGEVRYQEGPCSSLVPPPELLAGIPFARPRAFMLLTGTVPVLGGIRPSARFRAELHDPRRRRSIHLGYDVVALDGSVTSTRAGEAVS